MLGGEMFSISFLFIIGISAVVGEDSEAIGITETVCEKQKTTYGYEYNELFKFSDKSYVNGTLYLTFRVQAASNAHVIFSVGPSLDTYGQIYEIVLGAGRNTFSDIRRYIWKRGPASRAKAFTNDLLSASELREFTISIARDGQIEIRKSSDAIPILYWKDPDPIPISYFGFSTWNSVYGIWYFDCYGVGSTTIDRPLTFTESLRRDLLNGYDRFAIPFNISDDWTPINISFSPYHAELDSDHGQITLVGKFMLAWQDEKLKWDPASYGNITSLQLIHGEIWKPELVLYNAVDHGINPLGPSGMVVSNKGEVNWSSNSKLQTRCPLKYNSLFNEKHRCEIQLGLWGSRDIFRLVWVNDSSLDNKQKITPLKPWLFEDFNATNKWIETPWYDDKGNEDLDINGKSNNSVLALAITLKDNDDSFYLTAISLLVIVLTIFFLSTFWISACDDFRGCLMLSTALLINAFYRLISYKRNYYVMNITYACFSLWLLLGSVASMYASYLKSRPGSTKPCSFALFIVKLRLIQTLFCLPGSSSDSDEHYRNHSNDITEEGSVDERAGNDYWYAEDWKAISVFVTRLTFYVSLICIIWYANYDFS